MYSTTRKTAHQSTSFYLSQPRVHIRLLRKLRILTPIPTSHRPSATSTPTPPTTPPLTSPTPPPSPPNVSSPTQIPTRNPSSPPPTSPSPSAPAPASAKKSLCWKCASLSRGWCGISTWKFLAGGRCRFGGRISMCGRCGLRSRCCCGLGRGGVKWLGSKRSQLLTGIAYLERHPKQSVIYFYRLYVCNTVFSNYHAKLKLTVSGTLFPPTDHIARSHAPTLPLFSSLPNTVTPRRAPIVPRSQTPNLHTFIHLYHLRNKAPTNPHPSCLTSSSLDPIPPSSSPPPISHPPPPPPPLHLPLHLFSNPQHTFLTNLSTTQSFDIYIHFFVHACLPRGGGKERRGWEGDDGKGQKEREKEGGTKKRKEKRGLGLGGGRGRGRADAKASKGKKQVKRAETAGCVRDLESYAEV